MGRKSRYEPYVQPHLNEIAEWIQDEDEQQICERLGISTTSFSKYKREYPELSEALKTGRQQLVKDLKDSLKKKAKGYYYEESKTIVKDEDGKKTTIVENYRKYAQPDTGAIHLLLKNLDPDWTNDDQTTIDIKRAQLDLQRLKAENSAW